MTSSLPSRRYFEHVGKAARCRRSSCVQSSASVAENTISNPLSHPVRHIGRESLVKLDEAVRDDEPIVTHEVAVSNGVRIIMRSNLSRNADFSRNTGHFLEY